MNGPSLFGTIATNVVLTELRQRATRTSSKHVIDSLADSERSALFDGISRRFDTTANILLPDGPLRLQAIRLADDRTLIPLLVVPNAEARVEQNRVVDGFACKLRDHFNAGCGDAEARLLLTLTPDGNETQRSAAEGATDAELLSLRSIARRLPELDALVDESRRVVLAVVDEYVRRQPDGRSWDAVLREVQRFVASAMSCPSPTDVGTALGAFGRTFMVDSSPDFLGPVGNLKRALKQGAAPSSRLGANAALRSQIESWEQDRIFDLEDSARGVFSPDAVNHILGTLASGFAELDLAELTLLQDTPPDARFDLSGVEFDGVHQSVATRADNGAVLIVAASDAFSIRVPITGQMSGCYVHSFGYDVERQKPFRYKDHVAVNEAGDAATIGVSVDVAFRVLVVSLSRGKRSRSKEQDHFFVVVHRAVESMLPIPERLAVAFEHQAWSAGDAGQLQFRFIGGDGGESRPPLLIEQKQAADGADLVPTLEHLVPQSDLTVRVVWPESDEPTAPSVKLVRTLEHELYRGSRNRALPEQLVDGPTVTSGIRDVRRRDDLDGWEVAFASGAPLHVKAWNERGEEAAVGAVLRDPTRATFERTHDGAVSAIHTLDAAAEDYAEFVSARTACLAAVAERWSGLSGIESLGRVPWVLLDLEPLRAEVEAYLDSYVALVESLVPEGNSTFDEDVHGHLLDLDTLRVCGAQGETLEVVVLPTHPWAMAAQLEFQRLVAADAAGCTKRNELRLSTDLLHQLEPADAADEWYAHDRGAARFRAVEGAPFTLRYVPQKAYAAHPSLEYVRRTVTNKVARYLDMHRHLKSERRTIRIGFVNPGDGQLLLDGLRDWIKKRKDDVQAGRTADIPSFEVLFFGEDPRMGAAFDRFVREEATSQVAETEFLLRRLRYRRCTAAMPGSDEDFVHICFVHGLLEQARREPTARNIDEVWDGAFGRGLLGQPLRWTRSEGNQHVSMRGLWIGDRTDPMRRALSHLLALNRGRKQKQLNRDVGLYWDVSLPDLDDLHDCYDNADWVVHLERELSLELFSTQRDGGLRVIEYTDQEDVASPGLDVITVTRNAAPYEDQLAEVLGYAGLRLPKAAAEKQRAAAGILQEINRLSGTWALDFLLGSVGVPALRTRLKGNVGATLVYRWLRQEAANPPRWDGRPTLPVVMSIEELIRATPNNGLKQRDGLKHRYCNEVGDNASGRYCDDLLVLYLARAEDGQPYRMVGRVVEVKFGNDAASHPNREKGGAQVRETKRILERYLGGDAERADGPFNDRLLSTLIKAQLEQGLALGVFTKAQVDELNPAVLSAKLATGDYRVEYTIGWDDQNLHGDVFLLRTGGSDDDGNGPSGPTINATDGVRMLEFGPALVASIAFDPRDAPTVNAAWNTLPHLGRYRSIERSGPTVDRGSTSAVEAQGAHDGERSSKPADEPTERLIVQQPPAGPSEDDLLQKASEARGEGPPSEPNSSVPSAPARAIKPEVNTTDGLNVADALNVTAAPSDWSAAHADAVETAVKLPPYDISDAASAVERLGAALLGHKIDIGADPSVREADLGPRVVRAYVRLQPGEKIASVRRVSEDIARDVGTVSADIHISNEPARHAIAFDLPIDGLSYGVTFGDLQGHRSFETAQNALRLGFCAGIEVTGRPRWVDLAAMPHMLVAGTTGSGKTVFLRSVLLTLAMHRSPAELDLRLSSSKPMDFRIFTRLPHARGRAMAEDRREALELVRGLVEEMDARIERLSDAFCDNLDEYNAENPDATLPRIVAVLDEFSETVLSFDTKEERNEFSNCVARLAQKARAAGIHLVLCMQRPDATVLQGPIKSNILHRFALKLPQNHDSRVILDENGAETLLGQGDMLYKDANAALYRLQVPFLATDVLKRALKELAGP